MIDNSVQKRYNIEVELKEGESCSNVQDKQLTITMSKTNNLQDYFLNQARKEGIAVVVHLVNGFQIKGIVKGFDNFTVIIDSMGKQQLIYKHAISTVTPTKPFTKLQDDSEAEAEAPAAE